MMICKRFTLYVAVCVPLVSSWSFLSSTRVYNLHCGCSAEFVHVYRCLNHTITI